MALYRQANAPAPGACIAAAALKSIADELDISVMVIHHTRKSGATGATGGDWIDGVLGSIGVYLIQNICKMSTWERK
ncbi:hypothetical protein FACS1894140_6410 [Spirochaetia bacterium]|nr:hypothetical protein FACS1894140_6410 [Spirochaetia bacterium]